MMMEEYMYIGTVIYVFSDPKIEMKPFFMKYNFRLSPSAVISLETSRDKLVGETAVMIRFQEILQLK